MERKKNKKNVPKINIKEQLTSALDIPREVVLDVPITMLTGNTEISVENFGGIIEYSPQKIRLNTRSGVVVIDGIELEAKSMTKEVITIKGTIISVAFVM